MVHPAEVLAAHSSPTFCVPYNLRTARILRNKSLKANGLNTVPGAAAYGSHHRGALHE